MLLQHPAETVTAELLQAAPALDIPAAFERVYPNQGFHSNCPH